MACVGLKAALGEIVGVGWYVVDVCGSLCCGEGAGMSTNKHARTQTLLQHSFTLAVKVDKNLESLNWRCREPSSLSAKVLPLSGQ